MKRRDMLGRLCGLAALTTPVVVETAKTFLSPWVWSGWRQPVNQDIHFGWWAVDIPKRETGVDLLLSTTGGMVYETTEGCVVDTHHRLKEGFGLITGHLLGSMKDPEGFKEERKQLALLRLREAMAKL